MIRAGSSPSEARQSLAYRREPSVSEILREEKTQGRNVREREKEAQERTADGSETQKPDIRQIHDLPLEICSHSRFPKERPSQPDENQSGGSKDGNGRGSEALETARRPSAGSTLRRVKNPKSAAGARLPREGHCTSQAAKARAVW